MPDSSWEGVFAMHATAKPLWGGVLTVHATARPREFTQCCSSSCSFGARGHATRTFMAHRRGRWKPYSDAVGSSTKHHALNSIPAPSCKPAAGASTTQQQPTQSTDLEQFPCTTPVSMRVGTLSRIVDLSSILTPRTFHNTPRYQERGKTGPSTIICRMVLQPPQVAIQNLVIRS